jgi:hypothetical protein
MADAQEASEVNGFGSLDAPVYGICPIRLTLSGLGLFQDYQYEPAVPRERDMLGWVDSFEDPDPRTQPDTGTAGVPLGH